MSKTKTILAALVVAMTASAHANSVQQSVDLLAGSLNASITAISAVGAMSGTTMQIVAGASAQTLDFSANIASDAGTALHKGSILLVTSPVDFSKATSAAVGASVDFVIVNTKSAASAVRDESVALLKSPSGESVVLSRVVTDALGNVLTLSGQSIQQAYGEDASVVKNASGAIVQLTVGSAVLVKDTASTIAQDSGAALIVVSETGLMISKLPIDSAADVVTGKMNLSQALSALPGASFDQSAAVPAKYGKRKSGKGN
ncbi:MAG: hypothetical protein ABL927_02525 [Bdellovibrionales bacterium]